MDTLVVIDMQNDFIYGSLGNKECVDVVDNVVKLIEKFKQENKDIYFTRDTHYDNYLQTQEGKYLPVPHCLKDSDGWQVIDVLKEYVTDNNVIDKPSFGSLELKNYLEKYDTIYICGVCTDICVISNAMILKAAYPETKIVVLKDCCAGVSIQSHDNALKAMQSCQIIVE